MAPLDDHEIEGVTAFAPPPAPTYRYIIALKSGKMSIWIEDPTTMKQWYKGDLAKSDYVTASNTIPDASSADYAVCFQESLDCDLDDSSDVQRQFTPLKDGRFRLELTVKIRVLRSVWSAQYTFDLDPVSVERIDILEAKLRDQQEALERLRHDHEAGRTPIVLEAETSRMTPDGKLLRWNKAESSDFEVNGEDGVIRVRRPGIYSISVVVNHVPQNHNQTVELLKGSTCIRSVYCSYFGTSYNTSISLGCTARFGKDEQLTVACGSYVVGNCYLSAVWLGK